VVAAIGFEPILNTFSTWSLCRRLGYAAMLWGRRGTIPGQAALKATASPFAPRPRVALRRGVEPLSATRQAACDTGRITQDESPPGAIRTPNPAFGGRGPIHLAGGCRAPGRIRTCTSARRRRGADPARHGRVAPGVGIEPTASCLTGRPHFRSGTLEWSSPSESDRARRPYHGRLTPRSRSEKGKADVPARATPWGTAAPMHAVF
jgi:hypothetical protein